jgi:hypothetical protein
MSCMMGLAILVDHVLENKQEVARQPIGMDSELKVGLDSLRQRGLVGAPRCERPRNIWKLVIGEVTWQCRWDPT